MTEVRPTTGRHVLRSRRTAVRSGMGVCLALAVIYSFGYPGSTPLSSTVSSNGTVLAQGSAGAADSDSHSAPTGFVGEQLLQPAEILAPYGKSDSLVPGGVIPGVEGSGSGGSGSGRGSVSSGPDRSPAEPAGTMERPGKGMLIAPLQFLTPSSPFGLRTSPITGEHGEFHSGQDFAAPCGTRVFSADAGTVRAAGWHPWGGGNRVEVDHGNGLVTTYNHLEGVAVKTGDRVGAGQVIATVGTTGWSTGCHLHFETILNGEHTNPSQWKLISLDGSGPVGMPSLVNFTPGTGNEPDGETAWVAYLASGGSDIHPIAVKSPSRVDAETSAIGKRPSTGSSTASASGKPSSGKPRLSSSPSTSPAPQASPSKPGTSTATPGTTTKPTPGSSTSPNPTPPVSSTPPATSTPPADPTPPATSTPPTTSTPPVDPTPPADPTPAPPADPTPVPPADPTPVPPLDPTPEPPAPSDPAPSDPAPSDPAPSDPVPSDPTPSDPVPTPTITPTEAATADPGVCDAVIDPVTGTPVDPVTGAPVDPTTVDPVTGTCAVVEGTADAAAAGADAAREPESATVQAP